MKTFLFFLVVLPFLPGLLLAPDVTYPSQNKSLEIGDLNVENSVLNIQGSEKIRHQITISLSNRNFSDESCRPTATYLKSTFLNTEFTPSVFRLWTAEDDHSGNQDIIGLATANYDAPEVSTITINFDVKASQACKIQFDENVQLTLSKKMRRWWPWNIVADLIYSV